MDFNYTCFIIGNDNFVEFCTSNTFFLCSQPLLLDRFKFDLRLYVFITSCDPLRLFLYNDGLVSFTIIITDQLLVEKEKNYLQEWNSLFTKNSYSSVHKA